MTKNYAQQWVLRKWGRPNNISICAAIISSPGRRNANEQTNKQSTFLFYIRLTVRADGNSISHLRKALVVTCYYKATPYN